MIDCITSWYNWDCSNVTRPFSVWKFGAGNETIRVVKHVQLVLAARCNFLGTPNEHACSYVQSMHVCHCASSWSGTTSTVTLHTYALVHYVQFTIDVKLMSLIVVTCSADICTLVARCYHAVSGKHPHLGNHVGQLLTVMYMYIYGKAQTIYTAHMTSSTKSTSTQSQSKLAVSMTQTVYWPSPQQTADSWW